jgi:hypothetical protein
MVLLSMKKKNGMIISKVINQLATTKKSNREIALDSGVSHGTVNNVIKQKKDIIQAKKEKYIKLIDQFSGGDIKQAETLADVLNAKTEIYNFKGQVVGARPDYKVRLETIKYIDKLKGREQQSIKQTQNNMFIGNELNKYLR